MLSEPPFAADVGRNAAARTRLRCEQISPAHSYRSVKSILEHGLDRVPPDPQVELSLPAEHENVRGAAYYRP